MNRLRNLLFALGVFAALGFGAVSAWAEVGKREAATICPFLRTDEECETCCGNHGYTAYLYQNRDCSCF